MEFAEFPNLLSLLLHKRPNHKQQTLHLHVGTV